MSRRGDGILDFREVGWNPSPEAALTVAIEVAAVVVLAVLVGQARHASTPALPR
jgi:hypothetical protein